MKRPLIIGLTMATLLGALPAYAADSAGEPLSLTSQQVERLGVRTAAVEPASERTVTSILATVTPALNARQHIAAPFGGTVLRYEALEGQTVEAGATLAVIASRDIREVWAEVQSLEAKHRTAKAAADRARMLREEGIISAARAEETLAAEAELAAMLSAQRQRLTRAGAAAGNDGEYRLIAPAAGRISSIALSPGDHVEEMETVVTLDTEDTLWIEGHLPASMVGRVGMGDVILIEGLDIRGTVVAVAGSIDPMTRSAILRASVPADPRLVAGQTIRISVLRPVETGAFNVPRNAVVRLGDEDTIFIAAGNSFLPQRVDVLGQGAEKTTIAAPIDAAAEVAVAGLTELKVLALQD